jgi:hypothetical protein
MNGRLAAGCDPDAVAKALDEAIGELARYDARAVREDCVRRYSSSRIVSAYERMLSSVVS